MENDRKKSTQQSNIQAKKANQNRRDNREEDSKPIVYPKHDFDQDADLEAFRSIN